MLRRITLFCFSGHDLDRNLCASHDELVYLDFSGRLLISAQSGTRLNSWQRRLRHSYALLYIICVRVRLYTFAAI